MKRYTLVVGGHFDAPIQCDEGAWVRYEDHAAEVERLSTEGLHHVALILAARNALPDLIAELRMLRAAHEEREEVQAAWGQGLREAYEAGRRDALREAIDLCRRTEAGDTNHDWREAAKCCRELIASLAAKADEEAAIRARRRVREVLEANGTNPERFVSEWCRAQAEYEAEESAR